MEKERDKYGSLPSNLPPDLRQRHAAIYTHATEMAKAKGWNPELDEDD